VNKNTILLAIAALVAVLGVRSGDKGGAPSDLVRQAFVSYEKQWRDTNALAADGLASGEIKTEADAHDWIESRQKEIRRKAFAEIAKREQDQLGGGKWTAEKHAEILRGWAGGQ
jgi:hypothetical protein